MGLTLNMDNLHAPTVLSGPTSGTAANNGMQTDGLTFEELRSLKYNTEAELEALSGVLDSHGVDMSTRLLTPDGFPRADLDVAQIRTIRSRIIYLKNDRKALMDAIEKYLHEFFARKAEELLTPRTTETIASLDEPALLDLPFAKVNSVAAGSPADEAGLKAGDTIRNFGYVNHSNHDDLKRVGECVQGNEGREVMVKVSRNLGRQELQLTLTPRRNWGGRGLLGCHILPL